MISRHGWAKVLFGFEHAIDDTADGRTSDGLIMAGSRRQSHEAIQSPLECMRKLKLLPAECAASDSNQTAQDYDLGCPMEEIEEFILLSLMEVRKYLISI
jgi:hypothetical protein